MRPSSRASAAITSSTLNLSPSGPRSNSNAHPPRSMFSEPPGSSITPSTVTNCDTTSLPIVFSFGSTTGTSNGAAQNRHSPAGQRLVAVERLVVGDPAVRNREQAGHVRDELCARGQLVGAQADRAAPCRAHGHPVARDQHL